MPCPTLLTFRRVWPVPSCSVFLKCKKNNKTIKTQRKKCHTNWRKTTKKTRDLEVALNMVYCQAFHFHELQHTFRSCFWRSRLITGQLINKYGINRKRKGSILSLPPSWLTASTKHSWSSGVQRMRGLAALVAADDELITAQVSPELDGTEWWIGGSCTNILGVDWVVEYTTYMTTKNINQK